MQLHDIRSGMFDLRDRDFCDTAIPGAPAFCRYRTYEPDYVAANLSRHTHHGCMRDHFRADWYWCTCDTCITSPLARWFPDDPTTDYPGHRLVCADCRVNAHTHRGD